MKVTIEQHGETVFTLPACTVGTRITLQLDDGTETTYFGVQTGKDSPPYWVELVPGLIRSKLIRVQEAAK